MNNIVLYIKESYNELVHKVSWPSTAELLGATKVVIIASIIFALMVLAMSFVSETITKFLYSIKL